MKSFRRPAIFCAILLGVLLVAYTQTEQVNFAEHQRFDHELDVLGDTDTELNQSVLRAHARLTRNYDAIPEQLGIMKSAVSALSQVPFFIRERERAPFRRELADFTQMLAAKEVLLEDFKSEDAVLNNSLNYLPRVVQKLDVDLDADEAGRSLEEPIDRLVLHIFIYTSRAGEDEEPGVRESLRELAEWRTRHPGHPQVAVVARVEAHVRSIVCRKPKIEALMEKILALPTEAATNELLRLYEVGLAGALHRTDVARWALGCGCALLLLGVGYTIFALDAANRNLESRVAARTADLLRENEQRRLAEVSLRRQEAELRILFDLIPALVWYKDTQNNFLRVNQRVVESTGKPVEEIEGKSAAEVYPQEAEGYYADDLEVIRSGVPKLGIVEHLSRPDGGTLWIQTDKVPVHGDDGKVVGIVVMAKDVTEREKAAEAREAAELQVRFNEKRYRSLVEATSAIVWDTPDPGEFVTEQPGWTSFTGQSFEELRGWGWLNAIHPDDQAEARRLWLIAVASRSTNEVEYRLQARDQSYRQMLVRVVPILADDGAIQQWIGVASDITDRKRLEAELIEANKLQTIGQLAGGIAHDFNTLLTAILGHAELIREAVPPSGELAQSAEQIGQAANRAATLTRQLLAFSRKQMLQNELIDLNAVVAEAEPMLRRFVGDTIEMRTLTKAEHSWTKADVGQVQQVLVQLAMNARDAMPEGGRLTLETADATLDEFYASHHAEVVPGNYVLISIGDTGTGIPDHVMPHLFEPFFTTKKQGEGTGLGLAMCYGIVKQIGGHLCVHSELGAGTTFNVYLPRAATSVPALPTGNPSFPVAASTRGKETILLVEADANLRELAALVLGKLGYTVHSAAKALDAVRLAERASFIDLILMHVNPETEDRMMAERLRAANPELKILFTAGRLNGGGAGDDNFLAKPYTPTVLARKVREVIDGPARTVTAGSSDDVRTSSGDVAAVADGRSPSANLGA